ncbi:MAG: IS5 family transposase [Acidobacteriaceae bacterium]
MRAPASTAYREPVARSTGWPNSRWPRAAKKGRRQGSGGSRGGLTTKIHLLTNQLGEPIDFRITGGQLTDCTRAIDLLGQRRAEAVIADKGYDADSIVAHVQSMRATAVIPSRRKKQRAHDQQLYKQRNRIERCFSRLKQFRRLAIRYEKSKACFLSLAAPSAPGSCFSYMSMLYITPANPMDRARACSGIPVFRLYTSSETDHVETSCLARRTSHSLSRLLPLPTPRSVSKLRPRSSS